VLGISQQVGAGATLAGGIGGRCRPARQPNPTRSLSTPGLTRIPGAPGLGAQVGLFEDSQLAAIHARRVTIMVKDMLLARRMRHE
jgi:hypothetical protein